MAHVSTDNNYDIFKNQINIEPKKETDPFSSQ